MVHKIIGDKNMDRCYYCKSKYIKFYGNRKTEKRGVVKRYFCKKCGRTFVENEGFRWKHHDKRTILGSIHTWMMGLSLRDVHDFFSVSKNSVYRWFLEYGKLILGYVGNIKPFRTERLHMDEMFIHMSNTFFYVWASICREYRFTTAFLSDDRTKKNAKTLIKESPPALNMTTDGAFAYGSVIKEVKGLHYYHNHYHRCADFEDKKNNNLIERWNNSYRADTHKHRGFKKLESGDLFVRLWTFYYNFIRDHSVLGKTPAEEARLVKYYGEKTRLQRWEYWVGRATNAFYLLFILPYLDTESIIKFRL